MRSVRVSLGCDTATLGPLHETLCTSPALEREVVLGGQAVDGVETITSFVYEGGSGDGRGDYESALEDLEAVREYDATPADEGFFLYLRRELGSEGLSLLNALAQETVVVVPPIELRADRTIRTTIVGRSPDLTAVIESLSDGVTVDVLWTSDGVTTTETAASDRQLTALRAARAVGYYEVPRRNGIEAVADELDCAVSTASTLLRRGEANVIDRVLDSRR
ncbi:helix-turn-helix domain-containing protein [Halopiger aswanensis]|uniref:DNA binding protein with HTH domain n=1 Tax=Halopiger aswanensis TaxID=148449 RepID=A0A419WE84_9EURY|nr:helix-turn-helix domain-containing protein [Halopiger aswanensis]RKD93799.1 DNA binding protein with HTH domain [Halopiger aswanensis]